MATKTTKTIADNKDSMVMHNITVRPIIRTSQDVTKWRKALQSAEAINPIFIPLYDLYEDIKLDTVLSSLVEKRILGVTKTKLLFTDKDGNENEEITTLIANSEFRKLRREIQLQKMWGISIIECQKNGDYFQCYTIPRKHIRADLGKIVFEQYGIDGIDYKQPPYSNFLVEIGNQQEQGLFLKAAPYVIYKRGSFGDWAQYAEIFGMPFRDATYDGYNETARLQLIKAMEEVGSANYIVRPKETDINFLESKSTNGSAELYNMLRKACNEELSILILGQTETTTSSASSGYAQSKIHQQGEDAINFNDKLDELSILNEKIIPILATLGYPVADGSFVHVPDKEKVALIDKANVIDILKNNVGLPMDDDSLYEEFGIKKPTDYAAQKTKKEEADQQAKEAFAAAPPSGDKPIKPTDKKAKEKMSALDKLRLKMADFFVQALND